jgi:hypothetical protein
MSAFPAHKQDMLAEYVNISCTQTEHIIAATKVKDPQDMLAEYVSVSCTQNGHINAAIKVKDPQDMLAEYVSVSCTQNGHIIVAITIKDCDYTNTAKYTVHRQSLHSVDRHTSKTFLNFFICTLFNTAKSAASDFAVSEDAGIEPRINPYCVIVL